MKTGLNLLFTLFVFTFFVTSVYAPPKKETIEQLPNNDDSPPHYIVNQAGNALISFFRLISEPENKINVIIQLANTIKHLVNLGLKIEEVQKSKETQRALQTQRHIAEIKTQVDEYLQSPEGYLFLEALYEKLYTQTITNELLTINQ